MKKTTRLKTTTLKLIQKELNKSIYYYANPLRFRHYKNKRQ
jgi:hypothetical protein